MLNIDPSRDGPITNHPRQSHMAHDKAVQGILAHAHEQVGSMAPRCGGRAAGGAARVHPYAAYASRGSAGILAAQISSRLFRGWAPPPRDY